MQTLENWHDVVDVVVILEDWRPKNDQKCTPYYGVSQRSVARMFFGTKLSRLDLPISSKELCFVKNSGH